MQNANKFFEDLVALHPILKEIHMDYIILTKMCDILMQKHLWCKKKARPSKVEKSLNSSI